MSPSILLSHLPKRFVRVATLAEVKTSGNKLVHLEG
jgi:hypothetical protein